VRILWALLLAATGCRGLLGIEEPLVRDGGASDDSSDSSVDAPTFCATWDAKRFDPCAIGAPQPPLTLTAANSPYTYDATLGVLKDMSGTSVASSTMVILQTDGTTASLLNVESFQVGIGASLLVIGTRPLVIASWDTITIGGSIDAGSELAEINMTAHVDDNVRLGAGANQACTTGSGQTGNNVLDSSGGSGGGGGGGFHGSGGAGGLGNLMTVLGGAGGSPAATPLTIHAGCAGGNSGQAGSGATPPATPATRSQGGAGGGAIHLAARNTITMSGLINAGGAGGAGSPQGASCGGGGGGSGGYIGLESPKVTVAGQLAANGGGGGGGAAFAGNGNQGDNAQSPMVASGGSAQAGGGCGVAGANGAAGATLSGPNATGGDSCGGGGGGGGAGYILIWSDSFMKPAATISPPEILNPP
jgi:hypothetical protein